MNFREKKPLEINISIYYTGLHRTREALNPPGQSPPNYH